VIDGIAEMARNRTSKAHRGGAEENREGLPRICADDRGLSKTSRQMSTDDTNSRFLKISVFSVDQWLYPAIPYSPSFSKNLMMLSIPR
jgi:hypothetical protein